MMAKLWLWIITNKNNDNILNGHYLEFILYNLNELIIVIFKIIIAIIVKLVMVS